MTTMRLFFLGLSVLLALGTSGCGAGDSPAPTPRDTAPSAGSEVEHAEPRGEPSGAPAPAEAHSSSTPVCLSGGPFVDENALCEALLVVNYDSPSTQGDRMACGSSVAEYGLSLPAIEGGSGTFMTIADVSGVTGSWTTWSLVLEREGSLEHLAILGSSWERNCSAGGVQITRLRWVTQDTHEEPVLVIELHETGEYSCDPNNDDAQITDERYRILCLASSGGAYRCSSPGNSRDGIDPTSRLGPLPSAEGVLESMLSCPATAED